MSRAEILREKLHIKGLSETLKPGEYATDYGKCYACGKIERTEGEDHQYFIKKDGKEYFVSKKCWAEKVGKEVEKHPIMNPKKLRKKE